MLSFAALIGVIVFLLLFEKASGLVLCVHRFKHDLSAFLIFEWEKFLWRSKVHQTSQPAFEVPEVVE